MPSMLGDITANPTSFMFLMIFGVLGVVGIVGLVMATIAGVSSTRERERSRRAVAGHVANGSLSAEDGARLLGAGAAGARGRGRRSDPETRSAPALPT